MTILTAGSFRVSDYRKAIPDWVKVVCAITAYSKLRGVPVDWNINAWVKGLRFDHRPPLQDRPYDTEKGDFIPPQNDPDNIEAIPAKEHDRRTFGTKATTLGSDVHNRSHERRLRDKEARHQVQMELKRGDPQEIARILGVERKPKPKRKWPKRSFPKRKAAA